MPKKKEGDVDRYYTDKTYLKVRLKNDLYITVVMRISDNRDIIYEVYYDKYKIKEYTADEIEKYTVLYFKRDSSVYAFITGSRPRIALVLRESVGGSKKIDKNK